MDLNFDDLFGDRNDNGRLASHNSIGSEEGYLSDDANDNHDGAAMQTTAAGDSADAGTNIPPKPKRIVKNPQPKLDVVRLLGSRGIGSVEGVFREVKFQGKGHEHEDLKLVLKKLEHWAHRLYPKLPFGDTLEQIEKLGAKKPVQNHMKRLRLDMFEIPEETTEETAQELEPVIDIFDELLTNIDNIATTSVSSSVAPVCTPVPALSIEQCERMERNRRMAEEKRRERMMRMQSHTEVNNQVPMNAEISCNESLTPVEIGDDITTATQNLSEQQNTNMKKGIFSQS